MNNSESNIFSKEFYNVIFEIINTVERARSYSLLIKGIEQNKSIVHCRL